MSSVSEETEVAFKPPAVRVGDIVTYYNSWPKQERLDSKNPAWVTRVMPNGVLNLWFPTVNGQRFPESIMHIDDPMLAEMPERWQEGGWTLGPGNERVTELEAEIEQLREQHSADIAELEGILEDVLKQRMERAAQSLANRQAGAKRGREARDRKALARRLAANQGANDEEANS